MNARRPFSCALRFSLAASFFLIPLRSRAQEFLEDPRPARHASTRVFTFEYVPHKRQETYKDFLKFTKAAAPGPDGQRARYLVAELAALDGDFKAASLILEGISAEEPEDDFFLASVRQKLGDAYMQRGLFDKAAQTYALAAAGGAPAVAPEALLGQAVADLASGRREEAYARYNTLVEAYPGYKQADHVILPLGLILWENRRFKEALDYFVKDEKNPAALYFAGLSRRALKQNVEAQAAFKKVTRDHPKTVWAERARFELGETFYQQKDFNLAMKSLEPTAAESRDPWQTLAYYRLACSDFNVERFKDAEQRLWTLRKDVDKGALRANITTLLSQSLVEQDKTKPLVNLLRKENRGKEQTPDVNFQLIWSLAAVGRHEEAVKRSEQFLRAKWDRELTPKTLLIQGYCLGRLNRAPESVATYQLLVDRFPDTAFAAQGAHLMALAYFRSGQYVPIVTQVNHQWSALNADVRAKQPAALFWIGEAHLKLKNGPEARDAYQKFIDIAPPDHPLMAQAVYGQAVSYVEEGDVNNAVLTLQRAFQSASEKGDKPFMGALMLKTGDVHYNAKNYEEAAAAYRNFQTIDAKHSDMPVAMYREGLALHRAEYYSDAVTAWEKLVKAHPRFDKSPDALFRAAKTRFDMAQYPEAVKGYETLIKAYSKTEFAKDARLQIGQCWYNAGDFGRAIVHYTDFLNRFPDDPRAPGVLQLLQTAYFQAKKSPAEIEKLTKNQPKTPVLADIYWEEGAKRYNEKDYDKARDYFQKIIFEFPSSSLAAQASFYRAESFFLQEKFQEAAPAYQNFIQSYPEDGQISLAKFHMAISLFNRNEFAQAAEAFKDFARAFPDDPMAKNASLNAALCYAKSNDVDAATAAYEEYLKLYPDAEDAGAVYLQMGALLEKSGKEERAAEAYKSVPASLAEAPEAYFGAARCYQKLKKTEQEKEAYELLRATANKADPYRISGLLQLSNIYLTESQPDRALAVCRDVLQNAADPQSQAAAQECVNGLQQGGAQ